MNDVMKSKWFWISILPLTILMWYSIFTIGFWNTMFWWFGIGMTISLIIRIKERI